MSSHYSLLIASATKVIKYLKISKYLKKIKKKKAILSYFQYFYFTISIPQVPVRSIPLSFDSNKEHDYAVPILLRCSNDSFKTDGPLEHMLK